MKVLHIVPGLDDITNGMAVVVRFFAKEQGEAEVMDLNCAMQEFGVLEQKLKDCVEEVWVHGMWLPREWAVCWRVSRAGKRLVRMTHGSLSPVYLKQQGRWKKWLVGPIERYFLRRCEKIVATCEADKIWIEAYLGNRCPEIVVEDVKRFFNFSRKERKGRVEERGNFISRVERVDRVEGERFKARVSGSGSGEELAVSGQSLAVSGDGCNSELDTRNRELHVLYLGRRHPLKGVEFLEAAVRQLQNSTRSTRSTRLKIELKIVSNAFGKELERVWEWCDVLVLPTLSENFGLVVAEALERGKRVVTTDGAPVWGEESDGVGEWRSGGVGEWRSDGVESRYEGRLLYLKGYREGSDEERVRLLKDALMMV